MSCPKGEKDNKNKDSAFTQGGHGGRDGGTTEAKVQAGGGGSEPPGQGGNEEKEGGRQKWTVDPVSDVGESQED